MTESEAYVSAQRQDHPQPTVNGTLSPLRALCSELHEKVFTFLQQKAETEILKNVQAQCRHTISIIHDAIERYPYALNPLSINLPNTTDPPLKTRYPLPLLQRR